MLSGQRLSPKEAMLRAIHIAKGGEGFVSPNPLVGCVVLDNNGFFLAEGFHEKIGGPHAEIQALNKVSPERLSGAHLFITLEPCAHHGRTPPCADRLSALPLASVTYGLRDPNPLVAGKGLDKIKKAGIEVKDISELKSELEELAEIFLWNMNRKLPFVAIKVATSLDGQMALANGQSQWITGEKAREHAHYLRGCYDAVLVGRGTFEKDNPRLNSRIEKFKDKENYAIVLDPEAQALAKVGSSKLLEVRSKEKIIWVVGSDCKAESHGVTILKAEIKNDFFDLNKLFKQLFELGIASIYIEGGAFVFSRVLAAGQMNRLHQYMSPQILGSAGGISWSKDFKVESLSEAKFIKNVKSEWLGSDLYLTGKF